MLRLCLAFVCVQIGCSSSAPAVRPPVADDTGCGSARFLPDPALELRGPSPVGARTVRAAGTTIEIWYPAIVGSERGKPTVHYDLREQMPASDAAKVPDADNASLACDCYRDLPLDTKHGPYPLVLFLHGAASFRAQSAFLATHWASRGFIVVAPDLPGVGLFALLSGETSMKLGTALDVLDAVRTDRAFADIAPALDANVAIVGHSLGALFAATVASRPEVTVTITMAGAPIRDGTASHLSLYGDHDKIAPPPTEHDASVRTIAGAGHLSFTDLCLVGADRGGVLAIAKAHGIAIPPILEELARDGCRPTDAPFAQTAPKIRAITAGVLEERMHCDARARDQLRGL